MQTVAARAYVMDKSRVVASLDRAIVSEAETLSHHLVLRGGRER